MAQHLTEVDVKRKFVKKMGPDLGPVFWRLWNQCASLHMKWNTFVALYGTSQEHIGVMNQVAPICFRVAEDGIWSDLLLHVCRLTDPAQTGKGRSAQENLTLLRLPALIDDTGLRSRVDELILIVKQKADPIRTARNKRIGHHDLLLDRQPHLQLPTSRHGLKYTIKAITAVMHAIEQHYCDDEATAFEMLAAPESSDAVHLIRVLQRGLTRS